jgi:para-aminobenzoate synthetase component 1
MHVPGALLLACHRARCELRRPVIRELPALGHDALARTARSLGARGVRCAWLPGEGFGDELLAAFVTDELRLPIGVTLERATAALDALPIDTERRGWAGRSPAPRRIGYIAYECGRSLERAAWRPDERRAAPLGSAMVIAEHGAVARRDRGRGTIAVEGEDRAAVAGLSKAVLDAARAPAPPVAPVPRLSAFDADEAHRARVTAALELIGRGDLYQVCLARTFVGLAEGSAPALLCALSTRVRARWAASLDLGDHALVSVSPEQFLVRRGRMIESHPIKGTRPRGRDADADREAARALEADEKERAELTMIIDLMRSDLGRIASVGSVTVPTVRRIAPAVGVLHADAIVRAELARDVGLGGIFAATFPGGSVTGAPKVRAMEVIATLESHRRGAYCGAIVAIEPSGDFRASMTIRTLVTASGVGVWQVGGGIVSASDPAREAEETSWKSRAVELAPAARAP